MAETQPNFIITFKELAVAAIQKQQLGKVIMILDDSTNTSLDKVSYKTFGEVKKADWTSANYDLITLAFLGTPSEVICIKKEDDFADIQAKLDCYSNYVLVYPEAAASDMLSIKTYLAAQRKKNNYSISVLGNPTAPDAKYIINFATTGIKANINDAEKTFDYGDYTARVAGAFSGLPASRSLTYYELSEVYDCTLSSDPDADVKAGKLIILQQDSSYKLGRGVNSLTTLSDGVTEAFQKIRIVNIMDTIANDILSTFRTTYVGKYVNNYSNKLRFIGAINTYLNDLAVAGLLDASQQNEVRISYAKNKAYLEAKGKDTSKMKYQEIIQANTGSSVLLDGVCSPTDTMEDLDMGMYLYEVFEDEAA